MNVTVRFFASLRESVRRDTLVLALAEPTIAALRQALAGELDPAARQALAAPGVRLAVNQSFVDADAALDAVLAEGDEIAFLPPVTGG